MVPNGVFARLNVSDSVLKVGTSGEKESCIRRIQLLCQRGIAKRTPCYVKLVSKRSSLLYLNTENTISICVRI